MVQGALLINKNEGCTSRQIDVQISKKFHTKKVGHLGTLDPFAEGLLIVFINSGTKIIPFLKDERKTYVATLKLGTLTDTLDKDGKIILEEKVPVITKEQIEDVLKSFLGENEQIPPMYSSIKINGKHLYDLARRGIEIERTPRKINIYSIKLISFTKDEIVFEATVSKGTYIRTLGNDIAHKLNTIGHLTKLIRTNIDQFNLIDAKRVEDICEDDIKSIDEILSFMNKYKVYGPMEKIALNGGKLFLNYKDDYLLIYNNDGPIAIYGFESDGIYKCIRGLKWK